MNPVDPIRILFIDDDREYLASAEEDLLEGLQELELPAKVITEGSVDGGIATLGSGRFHLAVVDLKFAPGEGSGNDIIGAVLDTKVLPIIVLSGFRHELKDEYAQHGLIYVAKSKLIDEVVKKIIEWNERGVFRFFSEDGIPGSILRGAFQRTMWNHVSRFWHCIDSEDPAVVQRIAGRIAATLLHDQLASAPAYISDAGEVRMHHGEIYVFDTPRACLAVGDILAIEGDLLCVLTPNCDLVVRGADGPKADTVLLALCHDLGTHISENQRILDQIEIVQARESKKKQDAENRLMRLMQQDWENPSGRYFFLPPFYNFRGCVVDFLRLQTTSYGTEEAGQLREKRVVCLNQEMAAELATRFARYMIRLGQPAYLREPLIKAVVEAVPVRQ
jgi:ActR/RegA family two-component response regulator